MTNNTNIKSVSEYNRRMVPFLKELLSPLENYLGIHHFVHRKWYPSGSQVTGGIRQDFMDLSLENGLWAVQEPSFLEFAKHLPPKKIANFTWTGSPQKGVHEFCYNNNIWNGVTLSERMADGSIHSWAFGTTIHNKDFLDTYINQPQLLTDFVRYFKKMTKDQMRPEGENIIYHGIKVPEYEPNEKEEKLKSFLESISVKFHHIGKDIHLSPREFESVKLLAKGVPQEDLPDFINFVDEDSLDRLLDNLIHKVKADNLEQAVDIVMQNIH